MRADGNFNLVFTVVHPSLGLKQPSVKRYGFAIIRQFVCWPIMPEQLSGNGEPISGNQNTRPTSSHYYSKCRRLLIGQPEHISHYLACYKTAVSSDALPIKQWRYDCITFRLLIVIHSVKNLNNDIFRKKYPVRALTYLMIYSMAYYMIHFKH